MAKNKYVDGNGYKVKMGEPYVWVYWDEPEYFVYGIMEWSGRYGHCLRTFDSDGNISEQLQGMPFLRSPYDFEQNERTLHASRLYPVALVLESGE